jgi:hypothetical protein
LMASIATAMSTGVRQVHEPDPSDLLSQVAQPRTRLYVGHHWRTGLTSRARRVTIGPRQGEGATSVRDESDPD